VSGRSPGEFVSGFVKRRIASTVLWIIVVVFVLSCGAGNAGDDGGVAAEDAWVPDSGPAPDGGEGDTGSDAGPVLPVAACGMAPYDLIGAARVGSWVEYEEIEALNLDSAALDALLSQAAYTALSPVPYGCRVFRYRYVTQDRGKVVEATGTLGFPANGPLPEGEVPFGVFLHGTTGFADPCAPSRSLDGQAAAALIAALGFVSVAPDYIGMTGFGAPSTSTHAYCVGEQVAIGSWDALRAARMLVDKLKPGVTTGNPAILWGGSQGGHAALFMELYGPYYAPEFDVRAVVASVPPSVLMPLAQKALEEFSPPTIAFGAVLATMREWYGSPPDLLGVFTNDDPYRFATTLHDEIFVKDECNTGEGYKEIENHPELQRPDYMYKQEFIDAVLGGSLDAFPPWDCFMRENSLGTSSVRPLRATPTLMVYAENDDLVITEPMREDFDGLCASGFNLDYLECAGAGHSEGAVWSLPEQYAWLKDRLAGAPLPAGACTRKPPVCCTATPEGKCGR